MTDNGCIDVLADGSGVVSAIVNEGGDLSPLTPFSTWEDCLKSVAEQSKRDNPVRQSAIIPSSGPGASPAGAGPAWYPDIQPFNISQEIKLTPGYGEAHAICGTVRYVETCPDTPSHHAKPRFHRCHRPACPSCWKSWVARQTKSAAEAIEGYKAISHSRYDARHISIHPDPKKIPQFEDPNAALQWLYDESRAAAKMLGITAAITAPHPYRIRPEKEAAVAASAGADEMKRYEWALAQPNWADLVYFSPHMHILGYGHLMPSDEFYTKTGWTYTNHDEKSKGRTGDALRKTIYYLLTHAWVNGNNKVVRYWFGMSTHNMKRVDEGYQKIPACCPVCSAACVANPPDTERFDGTFQPVYQDMHNAPPAMRKVLFHHYEFREHKGRVKAVNPVLLGVAA